MHWIDIAWPAMGALSLALGLIHFLIWLRRRSEPASLAFLAAALAVAALSVIELGMMRATGAAAYAELTRWAMAAMCVLLNALVVFVWLYFRAGSARAAVASFVLHLACVLPNFLTGVSLMFQRVDGLEMYRAWDGSLIALPVATPNPWMLAFYLADAFAVAFFISVIRDLRNHPDAELRQRSRLLCGALVAFVVSGVSWAVMVSLGWLHAPFMVNVPFVAVGVMVSFMLGGDVIRAARLHDALERSRQESDRIRQRLEQASADRERYSAELALRQEELAHLSRVWMVGELSGSLAHELNQPLTAVVSNAQAALRFLDREQPDVVEAVEGMREAVASGKRAGDVIRRLRAMLRREPVDMQVLDLRDVVGEVLAMLRGELLARQVAVSFEPGPAALLVRGDRIQLQQVVLNLLVNACDAMEAVPGEKRASVHCQALRERSVQLDVRDEGAGIAPADVEAIFRPFFTTKAQGMGIGLAVCRSIVQAHGGEMGAARLAPRGSSVWLRLPVAEAVA